MNISEWLLKKARFSPCEFVNIRTVLPSFPVQLFGWVVKSSIFLLTGFADSNSVKKKKRSTCSWDHFSNQRIREKKKQSILKKKKVFILCLLWIFQTPMLCLHIYGILTKIWGWKDRLWMFTISILTFNQTIQSNSSVRGMCKEKCNFILLKIFCVRMSEIDTTTHSESYVYVASRLYE